MSTHDRPEHSLTPGDIGAFTSAPADAQYHEEAREKYHGTADWHTSQQRTSRWNTNDWLANRARFTQVNARMVQAVRDGVAADSAAAAAIVTAHRSVLNEFYPVTPAKHFIISRGYTSDERFRSYYDDQQQGLAQWLADAITADAIAHGVNTDAPEWA